ncbi:MAG TPA: DUF1800 domain-containing protein [Burkholderiaceae bacterium]|jgi:uncharacterized protein (DUF1800 family)|nr:DUF1800 domain-containing protein [Burkholderiaceae bacterium]
MTQRPGPQRAARAFARRTLEAFLLALAAAACFLGAPTAARAAGASEEEALHVLNRLSFGPAPGDLAHVMQIGVDAYVDEQLNPQRLPMPASLAQRLDALKTTQLGQKELVREFREAAQAAKKDAEAGKGERRELYRRVAYEAGEARLARAVESPRQLEEVMVDFWFNHFNVFVGKGLDRVLVANYEREAIRPYAMGRFRDLLGATAHHPAMLFYLDNWLSSAPGYEPRGRGPLAKSTGLNENYARELMELHTLGVDGGYTQKDVTELARMLTGWTIEPRAARGDSVFHFDARRHDDGTKQWLSRSVAPRGQAEGEWALDVLATHPSTAHHIAFKLAQYFVADAPPAALVDRLALRFRSSDGDIRAVLATLFASEEFRGAGARGAKFKTPYRYVVSSLRAGGVPVSNAQPLLGVLYQLGMPLYGCQTPDGYRNTEDAWLNPDAMTRRIGFATALGSGKLPLARRIDPDDAPPMNPRALVRAGDDSARPRVDPSAFNAPLDADALLATLGSTISSRTRANVVHADPALRAALVIGSPDFMRH